MSCRLGRSETPAENQAWVDVIARTGDWQGVAIGFLNSVEYVNGKRSLADTFTPSQANTVGQWSCPDSVDSPAMLPLRQRVAVRSPSD